MATWTVSSHRMQHHFGAKSANWLAIGIDNHVSNFIGPSPVEPWNEVETSWHERSDAHEGKAVYTSNRSKSMSMIVSEGPQRFGGKGLNYWG